MDSVRFIFVKGALRGAGIALLLSIAYLGYWVAIFFFSAPIMGVMAAIYGFILGVMPAILVGALAAAIIATLYLFLKPANKLQATILGVGVPVLMVLLPLIAIGTSGMAGADRDEFGYTAIAFLALYGIPILIFIFCGGYFTLSYFEETALGKPKTVKRSYKLIAVLLYSVPLLLILISTLIKTVPVVSEPPKTLVINVTWEVGKYSYCSGNVILWFVSAPGYGVSTCSQSLADYLESNNSPYTEITMIESRELTSWEFLSAWKYTVVSVGDWTPTNEEWDTGWLECSSTEPECGKKPYPIKDPFKIVSNDQNNQ